MSAGAARVRRFPAAVPELTAAQDFVRAAAEEAGLPAPVCDGVQLAFEEAFVNVCRYAYPHGAGEVEVRCASQPDGFALTLVDAGVPFDVLALPTPDLDAPVSERPIGGLGIHLIRMLAHPVTYAREGPHNVLTMVFRREGPTEVA